MLKAIYQTRKIIARQVKKNNYDLIDSEFSKYQKGFYWTNENIACYLNMFNVQGMDSALTIASSGDHIFNLVDKDIRNVDSFDINRLTEYLILGLKRAMIIKYNYFEYMTYINYLPNSEVSINLITDFIHELLPYMDEKYRIFWNDIANYNYRIQKRNGTNLNLFQMLYVNVHSTFASIKYNGYLMDEYCYNIFKRKLINANISFKGADALDIKKEFSEKTYDLILLSNVLDYANEKWGDNWDYHKLEEYIKDLESLCNNNGIIFLKYILSYKTRNGVKVDIFHDSMVSESDLKEELYAIPTTISEEIEDGLILKRVKIDK